MTDTTTFTAGDPTLPLPANVLARLRTAESLRAEVAGLTAERDALREELQTAGWERDTSQNEAAYLREQVLLREGYHADATPRIGRILTMGDTPPSPPEEPYSDDVSLVSIATGDVYVRAYKGADDAWTRYGDYGSQTDFATMAENGPWITVEGWRQRDHKEQAEAKRKFRDAIYNARVGLAEWPESTADIRAAIDKLAADRVLDPVRVAAPWLDAWQRMAGTTRMEWERQAKRNERLTALLVTTPHNPEWMRPGTPEEVCTYCLATKSAHVGRPLVASAVSDAT